MTVKELVDVLGKIPDEQQDDIEVFAGSGYGSGSPVFDVYVVKDMQAERPEDFLLLSTTPLF